MGEQLPFGLTTGRYFLAVFWKEKRIPTLLKTTINATYSVPVATLAKGNERMTRIRILCGPFQQQMGDVIEEAQEKKQVPFLSGKSTT